MGRFFRNDLHDDFGTWPLAYTAYGGADVGEIIAVAETVGDGDDDAFFNAWTAAAERLAAEADAALARGLRTSASELYLRASSFYATSYHPLYGTPVDERLKLAFSRQMIAFDRGLSLRGTPAISLRIPFEQTTLPAYLIQAEGFEKDSPSADRLHQRVRRHRYRDVFRLCRGGVATGLPRARF